ncbi:hypothetical protein FOXYSP1_13748 [Fusarium oxysporum f. sp. phaseoli]
MFLLSFCAQFAGIQRAGLTHRPTESIRQISVSLSHFSGQATR